MQYSVISPRITGLLGSQTSPVAFFIQNCDFSTRIAYLYWSQPSSAVFAFKTATLPPELLVSMGHSPHLWFFHAKQWLWIRITSLYGSLTSPVVLCMQNSMISSRITSLHGSQTPPVVSWMPTNVISIRITSLYGSQPSFVVFASKTATFGSELQVSMGPRLGLRFFAFKTASLVPDLQVSMGPSPHLWFLHSKQRL